ncbi:MAG: electron transfer flavoprotein subunit alpha/FixB family protein [Candidatus Promineifilaceae bacterium]
MILGLIEHDRGQLNPQSLEMLTLARGLAAESNTVLHAVLIGAKAAGITAELNKYGVAAAHHVTNESLTDYAPMAWAESIVQLAAQEQPEAILAVGTDRGNEVMAHVAARLNQPLAANCIAVTTGEDYHLTRYRWGSSLLEEARLVGTPKLLTVAPLTIAAEPVAEEAEDMAEMAVQPFTPTLEAPDLLVRVVDRVQPESDKVSLTEARVVVSGGRGVGSAEKFAVLEELATLLGGAVGGSRVATNLGWRPHSDQVGQTGSRVAPDLYIACGISGAIQHWVGCKASKNILAINTDPEAPMVTKATYAVIGDLHEVLPAVIAEIKSQS